MTAVTATSHNISYIIKKKLSALVPDKFGTEPEWSEVIQEYKYRMTQLKLLDGMKASRQYILVN